MMRRHAAHVLAIGDQALASLSTLVLTFAVSSRAEATSFGVFALMFSALVLLLNGSRAVNSMSFSLRVGAMSPAEIRTQGAQPISTAIAIGGIAGAGFCIVALVLGGPEALLALSFAVAAPAVLGQDAVRNVFLTMRLPLGALASDARVVGVQTAFTIYTLFYWNQTAYLGPIVAFCGGVWISLLWSIFRLRPGITHIVKHLQLSKSMLGGLLSEYAVTAGVRACVPLVAGLVGGTIAAGSYRAGESVIGIVNVVLMGLSPLLAVAFVRAHSDGRSLRGIVRRWSVASVVAVACASGFIAATWSPLWSRLLGASAAGAAAVIPALAIGIVVNQRVSAVLMALRARGLVARAAKVRAMAAVPLVVLVTVGVWQWEAAGAAIGLALGQAIALVLAEHEFRRPLALSRSDNASPVSQQAGDAG